MLVLWFIGRFVERLLGSTGFLIVYGAAAIAASIASIAWSPILVGAGASGAVYGLFGALFGIIARSPRAIPRRLPSLWIAAAVFVAGCASSFAPGVNAAGHVGGFVAGFVGGLLLGHPLEPAAVAGRPRRNVRFAVVSALSLAAGAALMPSWAEVGRAGEVELAVVTTFNDAVASVVDSRITDEEFADLVDARVIPPWRAERERLTALTNVEAREAREIAKVLVYMRACEDAFEQVSSGARTHDALRVQRGIGMLHDAEARSR
jgi:rhomboid protease GluP